MKIKEILRGNIESLIGEGRRFRSARELAQRAETLGLTDKMENLARSISRIRNLEGDTQLSTMEAIAGAAGLQVSDLLQTGPAPSAEMSQLMEGLRKLDARGGIDRILMLNTLGLILNRPETAENSDKKHY